MSVMGSGAIRRTAERVPHAELLELEGLERLACGCVIAVQRARGSQVRLVSLEAKGPHCAFSMHRADSILRLGGPVDWVESEEDDDDDDARSVPDRERPAS
jgi:hypothetical protein